MADVHPFKVDGWTVFKTFLSSSGGMVVWIPFAIGVLLLVIGCLIDVVCLIIGLMICIAVVPGIAALAYFSHNLSSGIVPNLIPHTVERTDAGFLLRIWRLDEPEDGGGDEDEKGEIWVESSEVELSDSKITQRKTSFDYDLLYFKDSPLKILFVPKNKKYEDFKKHQS